MGKLGFNLNLPKAKTEIKYWGGLVASSSGFVLAETIKHHDGLVVIFTPDFLTANKLEFEIKAFSDNSFHENILNFPDWEILPYDIFSPHKDIISQRLTIFNQISSKNKGSLIIPVSTALHRVCPLEYISNNTLILQIDDNVILDELSITLESIGYISTNQVMEHGEFAIHSSIIDLFPMGSENPFRIDIENNIIKTIYSFDVETQRSINEKHNIKLLPAKEFPTDQHSISKFRTNWRTEFVGDPNNCQIYKEVSNGILSAGLEYYLPLFFEKCATIFDYFPSNSLIIRYEDTVKAVDEFYLSVVHRYEQCSHDIKKPILKPNRLFLAADEFFHNIKMFKQISVQSEFIKNNKYAENFTINTLPDLTIASNYDCPLYKVQNLIKTQDAKILFCAETSGRKAILAELFIKQGIHPKEVNSWNDFLESNASLCLAVIPIETGFKLEKLNIIVITEFDIFGNKIIQRGSGKTKTSDFVVGINDLEELSVGTPVVHIEHGVGRYCGLQKIIVSEQEGEFVVLEYANNDKLYIPVSSLHLISRYSGAELEHAPLHSLGSNKWQKDRSKALEQIKDVAVELLSIYAKREMHKGVVFSQPDLQYSTFVAKFPFEETPDQEQAIIQVIKDLTSSKPMDRIICGDVGFGKTEIAMRAAFLAVQSEKQVAVLVPTTLLAQQHYQTFIDRFADFPIRISVLSRFKTSKEHDSIIDYLGKGKIDIVIGTHKLLQKNVKFKDLGLLIIDEEHRFGVDQKEKFKSLRTEVNILTMTATPIPRTLNMAMSKIRDLSIIGTPPAKRLSIKTFVREYDTEIIQEAISRELRRGGQVYYLHNAVETIEKTSNLIKELVPYADVAVAHGQMHKKELERIMFNFYRRKINVLVCTSIIETGIDIPTANTIIIERADKFGLAQLHQLRGRVGRSHHQSYAFCLTPQSSLMTQDAVKRLDAISSLETLGVGFTLATHDLEIRGAGELLGEEQSGNMQALGFNLYMELLGNAIKTLRSGKKLYIDLQITKGIEIDLMIPALIPDNYISDVNIRLVQYKRIAMANDENTLQELKIEMIDRFGSLPEQTKILFRITQMKLFCQKIGINKIKVNKKSGFIEFIDNPNIEPKYIIDLISKNPACYKLAGPSSIKFYKNLEKEYDRIGFVEQLINYFIKAYRN